MVMDLVGLAALRCLPLGSPTLEQVAAVKHWGTPIRSGPHATGGLGPAGASIAFTLAGILAFQQH